MSKERISLIELFSGIGAQKRGIDMTGLFDCEVIATSDIDKEAIVSYAAIHNNLTPKMMAEYVQYPSEEDMRRELLDKNIGYDFKKKQNPIKKTKGDTLKKFWLAMKISNNLGDISSLRSLPKADMWTYSFPCTDLSVAGKLSGMVKGKTRSGLLYEVERLLEVAVENNTQPKYLLLENVKNLVGKRFKDQFDEWVRKLDSLGYNTYYQIVNGKNCGVPQNRERVFAISIRKNIDKKSFKFPTPFYTGQRMSDFLEVSVDEKYYISEEKVEAFLQSSTIENLFEENIPENSMVRIGNIYGEQFGTGYAGNIWNQNGVSPALMTMQGGGRQPHIIKAVKERIRIRKLTPTECFRLMGFKDKDVEISRKMGVSNSALYKQAGNSIITNCISLLMEHLYKAQFDNTYECFDENFTRPQAE